jgi:hypothetical protein
MVVGVRAYAATLSGGSVAGDSTVGYADRAVV